MVQMITLIIAAVALATECNAFPRTQHAAYSIASCGISSVAAGHSLNISVSCPRGLRYRISLLQEPRCGLPRTMSSLKTGLKIHYTLLTPDRRAVWCDGTNGTVAISSIATGGIQRYIAVSSVLDKRTPVAYPNAIDYADTVVVYVEAK